MALVKCPECGHDVSTLADHCPNCGMPLTEETIESAKQKQVSEKQNLMKEVYDSDILEKSQKKKKIKPLAIIVPIVLIAAIIICLFYFKKPSLSENEQLAVSCVEYIRSNLKDRTSLCLTDDIEILEWGGYSPSENRSYNENGEGFYRYMSVPYSATNSYGARVENIAFFFLQKSEDNSYTFKYSGDWNDVSDMLENTNWKEYPSEIVQLAFMLWKNQYIDGSGFSKDMIAESFPPDAVAKQVKCDVID